MKDSVTATPDEIERCATRLQALEEAVGTAVVGQRQAIRDCLVVLTAAGHALIEGVPGVGKTLMMRAFCSAIGGRFSRIQFTPDLMPSDVTGHAMFNMKSEQFIIRRGPIFANLLLGDEINRAPAKTQAAMLEAMQEQQVTVEGRAIALEPPFLVFATQNPIEQEGTYPLPQAQLDRFLMKILIDYPSEDEELAMVRLTTRDKIGDQLDISAVRQVLTPEEVISLQQTAARLQIDDAVLGYAVGLVRAARTWQGVETGPGPRTSVALVRAARGHALTNGNGFVTPDDVKAVAPAVLRHRLKLTADLEIEGYQPDDLLRDLLNDVPAPRT